MTDYRSQKAQRAARQRASAERDSERESALALLTRPAPVLPVWYPDDSPNLPLTPSAVRAADVHGTCPHGLGASHHCAVCVHGPTDDRTGHPLPLAVLDRLGLLPRPPAPLPIKNRLGQVRGGASRGRAWNGNGQRESAFQGSQVKGRR